MGEMGDCDKKGLDDLMENCTVIAVNVMDSAMGDSDDDDEKDDIDGDYDSSFLGKPDANVTRTPSNRSANNSREIVKGKKLGHRRVKDGEVTYKRFETTQLMGSIQLGIQQSVGNLASQEERDLLHADFYTVDTVTFSRDGALEKTPAHNYSQFRFRTYAPLAFRKFRNDFKIERDMFLVSLCAEPMRELSNPGASGSIFYVTQDDEIICKTVSHKEGRFLQEILPAYYLNLHQNRRTLLPKFFGFYCYSSHTKNVRIIVMKNLLPSGLEMHHKFDLKGSTYKRKASKKERVKSHPTHKDLDFMEMYPEGILLQGDLYNSLMDTIERDCRALESLKIMDYSLLLGIHNVDQANAKKNPMPPIVEPGDGGEGQGGDSDAEASDGSDGGGGRKPAMLERIGSFTQRQRLIAHSTALESITAEVDDAAISDFVDETDTAGKVNLWGGIPAKNHKGENLLLFIGIIDILQSFGVAKKLEHAWKSLVHDGDTVSVHRPSFFADRFKTFMKDKVFRKMPAQLKPALSFRRGHFRRTLSKDKEDANTPMRPDGPTRRSQPSSESAGVTVITISGEPQVLPSVLRDRPPRGRHPSPGQTKRLSSVDHDKYIAAKNRPDVADVVAIASCTPPPDNEYYISSGITSGDERVQIYVPSPQSTPYSTIQKHHSDQHKSITFLNYKADPDSIISTSTFNSNVNGSLSKEGSTAVSQVTTEEEYETMSERSAVTSERSIVTSERSILTSEQSIVSSDRSVISDRSVSSHQQFVSISNNSQTMEQDSLTIFANSDNVEPDSLTISINSQHLEPDSLTLSEEYSEQLKEPISLSEINLEVEPKS